MKILIEESALDSIKRMAQEVQDQRDELLVALQKYQDAGIGNSTDFQWQLEARKKARAAIARCQESTKVFE